MANKAVCMLIGEGVTGRVEFVPEGEATRVFGTVTGLAPGPHGFHIHVFGDTTNGCASCGGHFNPSGATHGAPDAEVRHAGDLGNILAGEDGTALVDIIDKQIPVNGPLSIIGRSVVVHAGADDLGQGGDEESLKTGNAGARVACGVIALSG